MRDFSKIKDGVIPDAELHGVQHLNVLDVFWVERQGELAALLLAEAGLRVVMLYALHGLQQHFVLGFVLCIMPCVYLCFFILSTRKTFITLFRICNNLIIKIARQKKNREENKGTTIGRKEFSYPFAYAVMMIHVLWFAQLRGSCIFGGIDIVTVVAAAGGVTALIV